MRRRAVSIGEAEAGPDIPYENEKANVQTLGFDAMGLVTFVLAVAGALLVVGITFMIFVEEIVGLSILASAVLMAVAASILYVIA